MNDERTGRQVLLVVGGVVVGLAGLIGFFIGSNSAASSPTFEVFETVALPTTPVSVALYGMLLTSIVLGGLFVAVEAASRYDDR
ncbi:hypothetical protein SAMN04487948_105412 [Halogranum amylolyticum]|uniref:Cox cluster protein n=1 Tax=Halogranum amylolyticum TaxID=660520 RepID=A0A1H8SY47_9EURY|nr:hypothetical protein [Halogranum amylolyticum]SEO83899.1 hypothetical protein SAMN04487948_105412 [Halogranum amylolyticum]